MHLTVDIEQRCEALLPGHVLGVAGEIASVRRLNGLNGQDAAAAANGQGADAQPLVDRLTVQRPFDLHGQIAQRHGAVQRQVLAHLGGALFESEGCDARQN